MTIEDTTPGDDAESLREWVEQRRPTALDNKTVTIEIPNPDHEDFEIPENSSLEHVPEDELRDSYYAAHYIRERYFQYDMMLFCKVLASTGRSDLGLSDDLLDALYLVLKAETVNEDVRVPRKIVEEV